MAKNIEIKAKLPNAEALLAKAKEITQSQGEIIHHRDIFYKTPKGRLKMRFFDNGSGELIFYERPDSSAAKTSEYHIHATDEPATLHGVLVSSPGVAGMVSKIRTLFLIGQTRLHIDEVEGLGSFMELEVVLKENQSSEEGEKIANEIYSSTLELDPADQVSGSYFDLIQKENHGKHTAL